MRLEYQVTVPNGALHQHDLKPCARRSVSFFLSQYIFNQFLRLRNSKFCFYHTYATPSFGLLHSDTLPYRFLYIHNSSPNPFRSQALLQSTYRRGYSRSFRSRISYLRHSHSSGGGLRRFRHLRVQRLRPHLNTRRARDVAQVLRVQRPGNSISGSPGLLTCSFRIFQGSQRNAAS